MLTNIFQFKSAEGGMLPSLSNVDLFLGMARGMTMIVGQLFGQMDSYSSTLVQTKSSQQLDGLPCTHGPQKINSNYFGDLLEFPSGATSS